MINTAIGFAIGLVPLIFGIFKRKVKIGLLGFIGSILGGTILGIFLAIPIAVFCTYKIVKNRPPDAL